MHQYRYILLKIAYNIRDENQIYFTIVNVFLLTYSRIYLL